MGRRLTGAGLPAFRLSTGSSLASCTYVREHRVSGVGATGTVRFEKGSDTDVLLGDGGREWLAHALMVGPGSWVMRRPHRPSWLLAPVPISLLELIAVRTPRANGIGKSSVELTAGRLE